MSNNSKFLFLTSSRFWALVIGAVSIYLKMKGFIGEPEMMLIATITSGFTIIKTLDRNIGDAKAGITTVSMPSNVSNVQASTDSTGTTGTSL
jgi:hypothetical protein